MPLKNYLKTGIAILFIFACIGTTQATLDSTLRYENYIYEKDFRSVRLYQTQSEYNFPIINLNGGDLLSMEFDQLTSSRDYYQYTLIHCNATWEPSNISKTQYLVGMGYENIEDIAFSTATLMQYTHYSLTLPTENVKPRVSGNYLLLVYRNYDEADIVISRRIMVLDAKGTVSTVVKQSSQVDTRSSHQEVDFNFENTTNYFIPKPYEDLKTVILRGAEWMTAIDNLKPQYVTGTKYNFEYQTGNQIDGLNEFRYFDIRSLRMASANVKSRFNVANQKHVLLLTERTRRFESYFSWKDFNGRYLVYNADLPKIMGTGEVESDYCFVHFSIKADEDLAGKKVYVYGELSDWRIQEDFQCFYNADAGAFEAVIPLKQAYYNYVFAVVDDAEPGVLDTKYFEGAHSETENNYEVLVYHKNQTLGYDELIGYDLKNSQMKR